MVLCLYTYSQLISFEASFCFACLFCVSFKYIEKVIQLQIYIFFFILVDLLQVIPLITEYSSLCSIVGLCYLPMLYIVTFIC